MSPRDGERQRRILYAAAFLRALAIGLMAVLIGLYAARLGLDATPIGGILSRALWGAGPAALLTLALGPRLLDRAILVSLTLLTVLRGAVILVIVALSLLG